MLTDASLKGALNRAKAEKREITLRDTGKTEGLEFRASYGGKGSFVYRYKRPGEKVPQRFYLGTYSSEFGLSAARSAVEVLKGKRAQGIDPVMERDATEEAGRKAAEERKAAEAERARRLAFSAVADLYLAANAKTADRYRPVYEMNIEPVIGTVLACDVKRKHVQEIIDKVVERGAPVQSRRVFEVVRVMLRWAAGRDYLTGEPWRGVDLPDKNPARERVLTAAELRWLWNHAAVHWSDRPNVLRIVRLQILLGNRSGEIAGMRRDELASNLMTWTIPGERTKNEQTHIVPLPPLARQIIAEALAAADARIAQRRAQAIERDEDPSGINDEVVFFGARGAAERTDMLTHQVEEIIADYNAEKPKAEHVEPFTPHDIRRTLATGLETLGTPMNVISATLNHISAKASSVTSKHYAHADLSLEVRRALTKWQATIEQVLAGHDPFATNVEEIEEIERNLLGKGLSGVTKLRAVK